MKAKPAKHRRTPPPSPVWTDRIAREFIRRVRDYVGPDKWARIVVLTKAETDPDICHTGDYCDSNEFMIQALESFHISSSPHGEAVRRLWNASWSRAKELIRTNRA